MTLAGRCRVELASCRGAKSSCGTEKYGCAEAPWCQRRWEALQCTVVSPHETR